MCVPHKAYLLILYIFILSTVPSSAQSQTCAKKLPPDRRAPNFSGTKQVSIPVKGLPEHVINAFENAANYLKNTCAEHGSYSNFPTFTVDRNDTVLTSASTIDSLAIEWLPDSEAPDSQSAQGYRFANIDHSDGKLVVYGKCPTDNFSFCDKDRNVDWSDTSRVTVIMHEMGHVLRLDHDDCGSRSLMQAKPEYRKVFADQCDLIEESHAAVPVTLTITGLSGISGDLPNEITAGFLYQDRQGTVIDQNESRYSEDQTVNFPNLGIDQSAVFTTYSLVPTKTCSVSPSSVSQPTGPVKVEVRCECNDQVRHEIVAALSTAISTSTVDCPFFFPDRSKFSTFTPIWPIFGAPWYTERFGPASDPFGLICARQTVCTEGTIEVEIDGELVVTDYLDCVDMCVGGSDSIRLAGPSSRVSVKGVTSTGELDFNGFAVDRQQVSMYAIYVDGVRYYPTTWSREVYRPEACRSAWGQNAVNCDPNAGFQGTLDVRNLEPGTHTLQVIALDSHPSFRMASLAEKEFEIAGCGDAVKPSVEIAAPAAGASLSDTVVVTASASDNVGVQRVEFFVDGVRHHTDYSAPYTFSWNTTNAAEGIHLLNVRAWDSCDNSKWAIAPIEVAVDNHQVCDGASLLDLCFGEGRYSLNARIDGERATALHWSDNGGFFTLDEPGGAEIAVKYLDGQAINGRHWFFHGALTPLPYSITITDASNGRTQTLSKAANSLCGGADTETFTDDSWIFGDFMTSGGCVATTTAPCLMGQRFKVEVKKGRDFQRGYAVTDKTSSFGFGMPGAPEVVVKLYDGRWVNGHYWLFFGSLTTEYYAVWVTDTITGTAKFYSAPGELCGSADGAAF